MFNLLTTCYLFLGGAGGGALVVLSLLECARACRLFPSNLSRLRRVVARFAFPDELFFRAWPTCFVVLSLGILGLLFDLGRPDRLLNLVVTPACSPLTAGAYALGVSLVVAAAFSAFSLFDTVRVNVIALYLTAVAGFVAGLVTIVYTGVLLSGLASVLFWQTLWLPALFAFSSLSCGIGVVFLAAAFVEVRQVMLYSLRRLARVDSVLIVLESVCLVALVSRGFAHEGSALAALALVSGEFKWLFWGGLVALGLAIPLVMEQYVAHGNYSTQLVFVAALVLLGGFVLRWCMVGVAAYDATQLPGELYGIAQAFVATTVTK